MYNKIILIGHVGQDPKLAEAKNGTKIARFSLATNRKIKDAAGNVSQVSDWHNCTLFGNSTKICDYFGKGSKIQIEGSLQYRKFQDKTGADRTAAEIVVQNITLLSKSSEHCDSNFNDEFSDTIPF